MNELSTSTALALGISVGVIILGMLTVKYIFDKWKL
jgi:hypothetical protein